MNSRILVPIFSILFALLAVLAPSAANAQSVSAQVHIIIGSSGGTGVEASLAPLSSQLTRQFPQFDTFSLSAVQSVTLTQGVEQTVALPGGGTASVTLVGTEGEERLIRVTIPGGGTTIRTNGGRVFVGGSAVAGGRLILAIDT